ncbi:MAG: hypothetical protein K2J87_01810 [Muribaculaceae bacterium]|nr:hypothetical protein [Muribaculaceae bacterium]
MTDNIQAEINEELIKSHPLEEEDAAATKKRNEAHTNLLLNTQKIQNLEKNIEGLKPRIKVYEKEIDNLVLSHSPKWRENPSATLLVIEEEGKNFISISNNERLITEEINNAAKVLASLKDIGKDIEKILIDFQPLPASEGVKDNLTLKPESIDLESLPKFWHGLFGEISSGVRTIDKYRNDIQLINEILDEYYLESSTNETDLESLLQMELSIPAIRDYVNELNTKITSRNESLKISREALSELNERLHNKFTDDNSGLILDKVNLEEEKAAVSSKLEEHLKEMGIVKERLQQNEANKKRVAEASANLDKDRERFNEWDRLNRHFGGTRFRTLVQSYILRPLLRNANIYLNRITDRFLLTCSEQNEQLSILVLDRYNKNKIRSATVLSGGERFMISLALSLALSAMNKPGLNIDILFIDEGFGTLDAGSLNAVIDTLRRLPEIAGSNGRRVGVISHREELADCIDVQIRVNKCGEGRSRVEITNKIVN